MVNFCFNTLFIIMLHSYIYSDAQSVRESSNDADR